MLILLLEEVGAGAPAQTGATHPAARAPCFLLWGSHAAGRNAEPGRLLLSWGEELLQDAAICAVTEK